MGCYWETDLRPPPPPPRHHRTSYCSGVTGNDYVVWRSNNNRPKIKNQRLRFPVHRRLVNDPSRRELTAGLLGHQIIRSKRPLTVTVTVSVTDTLISVNDHLRRLIGFSGIFFKSLTDLLNSMHNWVYLFILLFIIGLIIIIGGSHEGIKIALKTRVKRRC